MLDLSCGGKCVGGLEAVEFFETLPDNIPDEIKDDSFCDLYERALNRLRFEVRKSIPVPPRVGLGKTRYYICGQCGASLDSAVSVYCPRCGRLVDYRRVK